MKITLDVPDKIVCAYINYLTYDCPHYVMNCAMIEGSVLYDGNEIKIPIDREEGE